MAKVVQKSANAIIRNLSLEDSKFISLIDRFIHGLVQIKHAVAVFAMNHWKLLNFMGNQWTLFPMRPIKNALQGEDFNHFDQLIWHKAIIKICCRSLHVRLLTSLLRIEFELGAENLRQLIINYGITLKFMDYSNWWVNEKDLHDVHYNEKDTFLECLFPNLRITDSLVPKINKF